jgi:hypothetical protein
MRQAAQASFRIEFARDYEIATQARVTVARDSAQASAAVRRTPG